MAPRVEAVRAVRWDEQRDQEDACDKHIACDRPWHARAWPCAEARRPQAQAPRRRRQQPGWATARRRRRPPRWSGCPGGLGRRLAATQAPAPRPYGASSACAAVAPSLGSRQLRDNPPSPSPLYPVPPITPLLRWSVTELPADISDADHLRRAFRAPRAGGHSTSTAFIDRNHAS